MTEADVEGRSELARFLRRSAFPADAKGLIAVARRDQAPDEVVRELARLEEDQAGRTFANVQEVWAALGHGIEERRT